MSYQKLKNNVAADLSINMHRRISSDLVHTVMEFLDVAYQWGKHDSAIECNKDAYDNLKKIEKALDERSTYFKMLVKEVRDAQDDVFNKDLEYKIEDLLNAVERW